MLKKIALTNLEIAYSKKVIEINCPVLGFPGFFFVPWPREIALTNTLELFFCSFRDFFFFACPVT